MFIDYYAVLDIDETVTFEEIKSAYKKQALKWHPDRNFGVDTTQKMQAINEAYLILKDTEARERYNYEYQRFKQFKTRFRGSTKEKSQQKTENNEKYAEKESSDDNYQYSNFEIIDEILKRWINNAKQQAVELAKQSIKDFKDITKVGLENSINGCLGAIIVQIIIGLFFIFIFSIIKSCN